MVTLPFWRMLTSVRPTNIPQTSHLFHLYVPYSQLPVSVPVHKSQFVQSSSTIHGRTLAGSGTGAPPLALEGCIGRLDSIVSYCCSGQTGFYALGRWLVIDCKGYTDGLDGMDVLDGTLVGRVGTDGF